MRAAVEPDAAADLEGVTWTLDSTVSTTADAVTVTAVPALERPATLVFDAGAVSVDTSCNIGGGGYQLSGSEITFDPITTTLIFCEGPEGAVEQSVLSVLTGTVTYTIEDDVLTLTNGPQGLMYVPG